ncbi:MAG: hypothetical protein N2Z22_02050 [Turneriella sp.]|nr:hypothetical protein [Turneriella sp.]
MDFFRSRKGILLKLDAKDFSKPPQAVWAELLSAIGEQKPTQVTLQIHDDETLPLPLAGVLAALGQKLNKEAVAVEFKARKETLQTLAALHLLPAAWSDQDKKA